MPNIDWGSLIGQGIQTIGNIIGGGGGGGNPPNPPTPTVPVNPPNLPPGISPIGPGGSIRYRGIRERVADFINGINSGGGLLDVPPIIPPGDQVNPPVGPPPPTLSGTSQVGGPNVQTGGIQIGPFGGTHGASTPNALALALASTRGNKRLSSELLLSSGAFNSALQPPIIYEADDGSGRVKYGAEKGNVVIKWMNGGQHYVAQMPKKIAECLGLWKPRKKPLISVRDSNAIRRANSAKKRLSTAAKGAGLYVRNTKPSPRRKPSSDS